MLSNNQIKKYQDIAQKYGLSFDKIDIMTLYNLIDNLVVEEVKQEQNENE